MKPLNKFEIFIAEITWGNLPYNKPKKGEKKEIDAFWIRESQAFKRKLEEFEKDQSLKDLWNLEKWENFQKLD